MLSGEEIIREVEQGNIVIKPFNKNKVNPNSYNLTLDNELIVYTDDILDCKKENNKKKIIIPEEGYILLPNQLYLAKTKEYTESYNFTPQISGRSSIGRIGLTVHISAGFGWIGFKGSWVLGLSCVKPVKIFPGMGICQIWFFPVIGNKSIKNQSKHLNDRTIINSNL